MLLTVVGNRPQFIKMAPVAAELRARGLRDCVVHTGQHYDENMSAVFFDELGLPAPDVMLSVTATGHAAMVAEIQQKITPVLREQNPRAVLVYGDTNSTLAAAQAATALEIPVVHVEAGPRSGDRSTPEEHNRILTDQMATLLFCPDALSVENLARENITRGVHFTGDLMFDSFKHFLPAARARSTPLAGTRYGLLTSHRAANTDDPAALAALITLCQRAPLPLLFPVHPRTRAALERAGQWQALQQCGNVTLCEPLGYLDMLAAMDGAALIVTDSGGLQKEGYFAGKPVIALLDKSPWPQLVADGWIVQAGGLEHGADAALAAIATAKPGPAAKPYFGDGHAAAKIVDALIAQGFLN